MAAPRATGPLLSVLAAVLSLSAGCLFEADPPSGSVAIYWSFWSQTLGEIGDVEADGATAICTEAAVDDVRITLTNPAGDLRRPSTDPCIGPGDVPGAAFDGLAPGTWGYLLEARRGGVVVFEAAGAFGIGDGARTIPDVRAAPRDGHWDVVVNGYTTAGCAPGDRLRFDLLDTGGAARVAFSTDDGGVNPPVVVPCEAAGPVTIPSVPPGTYRFSDWVHVDAAGAVEKGYSTCRPAFTQADDGNTVLTTPIDVTAAAPPPYPGLCP